MMTMMTMITEKMLLNLFALVAIALLMSLLVRFIITVLEKFGILGWLQSRANPFFHRLLTCPFCRSFWLAAFLSVIAFILVGYWPLLIVPIFVAPIGE